MKIKYLIVSVMIMLLVISTPSSYAGGAKLGTAAAAELLIPMGARSVGMGGANLANVDLTEAIYWNPAGLAALQSAEATFTYQTYFADMSLSYFTLGYYFEGIESTFGLSLQTVDIGDIVETTIESPEGTGDLITPQYLTFNLSFSKRLTSRIRFGLNTKFISESIGNMSATGWAWDFGIQYISDINLDFGIVLKNIGSNMQFDGTGIEFDSEIPWSNPNATTRKTKADIARNELPTSLQMGLAYRYQINEQNKLSILGTYASNSFNVDLGALGTEYNYENFIFLRLGYEIPFYDSDFPNEAQDYQYGLTFGAGINFDFAGNVLSINYAYRDMDIFDGNNYFTLGFMF